MIAIEQLGLTACLRLAGLILRETEGFAQKCFALCKARECLTSQCSIVNVEKIFDYFPEFRIWIKRIPLRTRILLFGTLFVIISLFPILKNDYIKTFSFVISNYSINLPFFIWIILATLIISNIINLANHYLQRKKNYFEFVLLWEKYKDVFWWIETIKYRVYDKNDKTQEAKLTDYVLQCHETREKIKVLLSKIGEKNLYFDSSNKKWNVFLEKNESIKKEKYASPFSFLTDFINPIAFHTHYGKYWIEVMYIGDSYVDNLKHSLLSKKRLFKKIEDNINALKKNREKIKNISSPKTP